MRAGRELQKGPEMGVRRVQVLKAAVVFFSLLLCSLSFYTCPNPEQREAHSTAWKTAHILCVHPCSCYFLSGTLVPWQKSRKESCRVRAHIL